MNYSKSVSRVCFSFLLSSSIFLPSVIFLSTSAYADPKVLNAEQASGKVQFQTYCSSCHGMDAKGDGPVSASLVTKPANLRQIAKRRDGSFPVAEIEKIIDGREQIQAHGSRDMPVWGRMFSDSFGGGSIGEELVDGKLKVLVEYLKSIQD